MSWQPPQLTEAEMNPFVSGLSQMSDALNKQTQGQMMRAQLPYVGQQSAADLLKTQLANQSSQAQLPYVGPTAAANLQNTQLQNQWYGPKAQSEIGLQGGQAANAYAQAAHEKLLTQNPLLSSTGPMGQLGALQYAKENYPDLFKSSANIPGTNSNPTDLGNVMMQSVIGSARLPTAKADWYTQQVTGAPYLKSTNDNKKYMEAQAAAFGMTPDEATREFINNGKTLKQIAEEKGYGSDPSAWPTPEYTATGATVTANQKRTAAVSELQKIEPFINEATSPYAQRILGWSPQQISDQAKSLNESFEQEAKDPGKVVQHAQNLFGGRNPGSNDLIEKQAKFIAASMIIPEYNAIRLRAQGVTNIGVEAMRDLGKASMNHFKTSQSLLSPQVYKRANEIADQQITAMNTAAQGASLSPFHQNLSQNQPQGTSAGSAPVNAGVSDPRIAGRVRVVSPKGEAGYILPEQLDKFIKKGFKRG